MEPRLKLIELHKYFGLHYFDEAEVALIEPYLELRSKPSTVWHSKEPVKYYVASLPCKTDWCQTCDGSGKRSQYDVEGYDVHAMIHSDDGYDHEFAESYFGGQTDVACNMCDGKGIQDILARDHSLFSEGQLLIVKLNTEIYEDEAESDAIQAAERRMGA